MSDSLVYDTKMFNLSTRGTACLVLNENQDYKSLCQYNIPQMIERDETIEYILFSIPCAVIPVSFYNVNENNSQLDVVEYNSAGSPTEYSVLFPFGNYNANYFIAEFIKILNASGSNTNGLANFSSRWNITVNNFTSTFTITNSNQYVFNSSSTLSSVMGFTDNVVSTLGVGYSATLPRCCNFLPLPRVTLRCVELASTTTIGSQQTSDIIITIPNNSKPNGQIYYQNQSNAKLLFRHLELNRFIISLTDDDGNLLNFNGISSFITLQFDIYRKFKPKPPLFSEIVDMVNNHVYPEEDRTLVENY